jgi:ribonuclease BN (tRNA processing enzyme)
VDLHVLGCHGGETPRHRTSAFLLGGKLAIDAGALTAGLMLADQCALEAVLVSHAHLDHVKDLATVVDNRVQSGAPPLVIVGTKATLGVLRKHFFNGLLWPDFSQIPSPRAPGIVYREISLEVPEQVCGFTVRALLVSHTIETCAFVVTSAEGRTVAYSGDTGPTERLWEVLGAEQDLAAVLLEVSFPEKERKLATQSGHLTPQLVEAELKKLGRPDLPILLYHVKPVFQREVELECARITEANLSFLQLDEDLVL